MILKWLGCACYHCSSCNPFPARAQGLLGAAMQAKDLTFPTAPTTLSGDGSRMTLLKPEGSGPFPAMVLHHQCDGLRHRNGPNRSMAAWAQAAVRQGFVVLLIDSLGPRDVDLVCLGPKNGVSLPRGVRDAMQAADHLRALPFIDKRRVAHVRIFLGRDGRASRQQQHLAISSAGKRGIYCGRRVYPPCFTIRPKTASPERSRSGPY